MSEFIFKKYKKKLSEIVDGETKWTVGENIIYCKGQKSEIKITDKMLIDIKDKINTRLPKLTKSLKQKNLDVKIKRELNKEARELRRFLTLIEKNRIAGRTYQVEEEDETTSGADG